MTTDQLLPGSIYLIFAIMLVLSGLINRRTQWSKLFLFGAAWVVIFGAGLILLTFRDELSYVGKRVWSEVSGAPLIEENGSEVRIPLSADGHFWVDAEINGRPIRFLVDSGATVTTIGAGNAAEAGIVSDGRRDTQVQTANGIIRVARARVEQLSVGPIVRNDLPVQINDSDDMNVLGMNFLSSLGGWGVDGHWLVLKP